MKFNSHDGFLRADQVRAKNCYQIDWIGCHILQVAQKAMVIFQFLHICAIPSSSSHEKHCQMVVFLLFLRKLSFDFNLHGLVLSSYLRTVVQFKQK